jgi:Flp pilus assembly protein TadG
MFRNRSTRGQTMVEFALILPIMMFLLTGFFDLGRVVLAHDALGHAAREAARYAIVHGSSPGNLCPVGPLPAGVTAPTASPACPFPSPSRESIRIEAREQAAVAGNTVTVEVCYGQGCVGDTDAPDAEGNPAANTRGTPVTVTVHTTVLMAAGSLLGITSFDVTSSSTMLVNY